MKFFLIVCIASTGLYNGQLIHIHLGKVLMMLEFQPALLYAFDQLADIMTAAFEDYFVPFQMTAERIVKLTLTDG